MKIAFICLGNICRSPMAEFIAKDYVKKNNLINIDITSAGTAGYHDGEDMHRKTKSLLISKNIDCTGFVSKKISKTLFENSDVIFVMDDSNYEDVINEFGENPKIKKITDYCTNKNIKYVPDPWYTNNFDEVYSILSDAILNFFESIKK